MTKLLQPYDSFVKVKVKAKFTLQQAMKAEWGVEV